MKVETVGFSQKLSSWNPIPYSHSIPSSFATLLAIPVSVSLFPRRSGTSLVSDPEGPVWSPAPSNPLALVDWRRI